MADKDLIGANIRFIYLTCKFFSKKVTFFDVFVDKIQLFVCFSKKNAPKICIFEGNSIPLPPDLTKKNDELSV